MSFIKHRKYKGEPIETTLEDGRYRLVYQFYNIYEDPNAVLPQNDPNHVEIRIYDRDYMTYEVGVPFDYQYQLDGLLVRHEQEIKEGSTNAETTELRKSHWVNRSLVTCLDANGIIGHGICNKLSCRIQTENSVTNLRLSGNHVIFIHY